MFCVEIYICTFWRFVALMNAPLKSVPAKPRSIFLWLSLKWSFGTKWLSATIIVWFSVQLLGLTTITSLLCCILLQRFACWRGADGQPVSEQTHTVVCTHCLWTTSMRCWKNILWWDGPLKLLPWTGWIVLVRKSNSNNFRGGILNIFITVNKTFSGHSLSLVLMSSGRPKGLPPKKKCSALYDAADQLFCSLL